MYPRQWTFYLSIYLSIYILSIQNNLYNTILRIYIIQMIYRFQKQQQSFQLSIKAIKNLNTEQRAQLNLIEISNQQSAMAQIKEHPFDKNQDINLINKYITKRISISPIVNFSKSIETKKRVNRIDEESGNKLRFSTPDLQMKEVKKLFEKSSLPITKFIVIGSMYRTRKNMSWSLQSKKKNLVGNRSKFLQQVNKHEKKSDQSQEYLKGNKIYPVSQRSQNKWKVTKKKRE